MFITCLCDSGLFQWTFTLSPSPFFFTVSVNYELQVLAASIFKYLKYQYSNSFLYEYLMNDERFLLQIRAYWCESKIEYWNLFTFYACFLSFHICGDTSSNQLVAGDIDLGIELWMRPVANAAQWRSTLVGYNAISRAATSAIVETPAFFSFSTTTTTNS